MGMHIEVTHGVVREPRTDAPRKKSAIGKGNEKFRISFIEIRHYTLASPVAAVHYSRPPP